MRRQASRFAAFLFLTLGALLGGVQICSADETGSFWNQWRGPHRDGRVADADVGTWPETLEGNSLQPLWRVPLGPSYSGPIVTEDSVFVTETVDRKSEQVLALERATGKEVWRTGWEGALSVPFFAKSNGDWIRSTPAYDDGRLYVAGMRDVLVCLEAKSGKELWRFDFVERLKTPLPDFGFVCSPLVVGDSVYVQAGASFAKLDKVTGELKWRSLLDNGGMWGSAFSSPVLETVAGQEQLLVQTRAELAGVDPASGEVLWRQEVPAFRGMNILTPTVCGGGIFTSAYGGRSFLYRIQKGDNAGLPAELEPQWENKVQGYMSSPVVIGGHIYLHLRNQRFTCIEVATGKECWTTRPYGKYWSLVANGDRILALDERGELLLIRANPESFELLGSRKISEDPTWAHLAVSGDQVFVRELNAMTVYRWSRPEAADATGSRP